MRKIIIVISVVFLISANVNAQKPSEKISNAIVYNIKVEELNDSQVAMKISNVLEKYKDRILLYEVNTEKKEIQLTLNKDENVLNILEVFTANGYNAWYVDNDNKRIINTGKGYIEKFPEKL